MYFRVFTWPITLWEWLCWIAMNVRFQLLHLGVVHVPLMENTTKCSSVKSGVFPFTLDTSLEEFVVISLFYTLIVAQCIEQQPLNNCHQPLQIETACPDCFLVSSQANYMAIVGDKCNCPLCTNRFNGVFPKWNRTFIEFSTFNEPGI